MIVSRYPGANVSTSDIKSKRYKRPHHNSGWTSENLSLLAQLVRTTTQTYDQLGKIFGKTRNAIAGKVRSMNLTVSDRPEKPKVVRAKRKPAPRQIVKRVAPPRIALVVPEVIPEKPVTIMELKNNMCRWPFGDHAPYQFCGTSPRFGSSSYCRKHQIESRSGSARCDAVG
jgi:hypothetical protein